MLHGVKSWAAGLRGAYSWPATQLTFVVNCIVIFILIVATLSHTRRRQQPWSPYGSAGIRVVHAHV